MLLFDALQPVFCYPSSFGDFFTSSFLFSVHQEGQTFLTQGQLPRGEVHR
jgi:hypothetical protein